MPNSKKLGVEVCLGKHRFSLHSQGMADTSDSIKKINYPMLTDPTGVLSRGFGVYIEEEGMAYRGTFLILEVRCKGSRDQNQQHRPQCRRTPAQVKLRSS